MRREGRSAAERCRSGRDLLPLASSRRRRAASDSVAVAAVFVHKTTIATSSPSEIVAQTFKLTMAELQVLFAIVEA